jgi:hypothetical protein
MRMFGNRSDIGLALLKRSNWLYLGTKIDPAAFQNVRFLIRKRGFRAGSNGGFVLEG